MHASEDVELFLGEILLFVRHSEFDVATQVFRRVATHRRPGAEVDFRGPELHFDVVVAEHVAQDAVGLPTGFAEHGAVGFAQEFVPTLFVQHGLPAEFVASHAELVGGSFPGVPVGAVLGGLE